MDGGTAADPNERDLQEVLERDVSNIQAASAGVHACRDAVAVQHQPLEAQRGKVGDLKRSVVAQGAWVARAGDYVDLHTFARWPLSLKARGGVGVQDYGRIDCVCASRQEVGGVGRQR